MSEETRFDLAALDTSQKAADGVEVEIRHPDTGEGLDLWVTVVGVDSAHHRSVRDKAAEKIRKRQFEDGRKYNSPSDLEDLKLEIALGDLLGWRGVIEDGVEIEFTRANARRILERYRFLVDQIHEAVHDRRRFRRGD